MIRVGDLVKNNMFGDRTYGRAGLVSQIVPYMLPSNKYREDKPAALIDEPDGYLHKDEYSCIVLIGGQQITVRAKWLEIVSRRK